MLCWYFLLLFSITLHYINLWFLQLKSLRKLFLCTFDNNESVLLVIRTCRMSCFLITQISPVDYLLIYLNKSLLINEKSIEFTRVLYIISLVLGRHRIRDNFLFLKHPKLLFNWSRSNVTKIRLVLYIVRYDDFSLDNIEVYKNVRVFSCCTPFCFNTVYHLAQPAERNVIGFESRSYCSSKLQIGFLINVFVLCTTCSFSFSVLAVENTGCTTNDTEESICLCLSNSL